jgi:RHS repeat-associated protein
MAEALRRAERGVPHLQVLTGAHLNIITRHLNSLLPASAGTAAPRRVIACTGWRKRWIVGAMLAAAAGTAVACPGDAGPTGKCDVKTAPSSQKAGAASVNIGAGNPINVMTGNKYQQEEDMAALPGVLGLEIVRHYNSRYSDNGALPGLLGRGWKLSYETELVISGQSLQVFQADGSSLMFSRDLVNPARAVGADPARGSIVIRRNRQGGDEYVWRWIDGRELSFDQRGKLVQIKAATGEILSLLYDTRGLLVKVTDPQGRSLRLVYPERRQAAGAQFRGVRAIDSPVGRFDYEHDDTAGVAQRARVANLVRVRYPGGAEGRQYHYEDAAHPSYLTGISIAGAASGSRPATWRYATYAYQADGKAVLSTHANDIDKVTLRYDRPGLTTVTNSQGGRTVYRYATMADDYRLMEVRGAGCALCGPSNQRYTYDKLGRLTGVTQLDAQGMPLQQTQSELDRYGRVLRRSLVAYRGGRPGQAQLQARYEYGSVTAAGPTLIARPSVVPGKEAQTRILYGHERTAHLPLAVRQTGFVPDYEGVGATAELRRATGYRYDAAGRLVEQDGPLANADRDASPANSDISVTTYDGRTGLPLRNVAPGNVVSEVVERDQALRPVRLRVTDGLLVQTTTTRYNWRGQPLEIDVEAYFNDAAGKPDAATRQHRLRSYRYDAMGLLTSTTTGGVLTTRILYDAAGRPTHRILPDGSQIVLAHDSEGRKQSELRYAGAAAGDLRNRIDFQYDAAGRLAQVGDSLGVLRRNSYDDMGRLTASSNAIDIATRYDYDEHGLLAGRTDADGTGDAAQIRLRHDILQQTTSVTDANGVVTERRYDDFGRKVMEANADRGVSLYRHDAAGRMVARIDQTGSTARYTYDHANRLVALGVDTQPALTHYRYQGTRLAAVLVTRDGKPENALEQTQFTYDALGQITEERRWLARVDAGQAQGATLRTVALKPAAGLNFVTRNSYDAAGRMIAQVLPDGHTLSYRYAPQGAKLQQVLFDDQVVVGGIEQTIVGGMTAYTFGNGIRQQMRFDGRGRMTQLQAQRGAPEAARWLDRLHAWWDDSKPAEPLVYRQDNRYDPAGRLVDLRRAHGAAGNVPAGARREQFQYDALNRLTAVAVDGAAPRRYEYDRGGNRLAIDNGAAPALRYAYAAGTNRLQAISSDTRGGPPQSAWLYHAAGMPLGQLAGGASGLLSQRITYDGGRRPVAIYAADSRPLVRYAYGSLGERMAKTVYGRDGVGQTSYSLYRDQRLAAETDADGRITAHYIYLYGKPVAKVDIVPDSGAFARLWRKVGGATGAGTVARLSAIHTDHLGVPQAMTDARQRIVWLARSDAFGAATVLYAAQADGERASMPLRLPGQVYDAETGLHQNYYRDYDPRTGRYTTPDPMGLEGGLNPYAYVSSNPLANIDPLGLYESDIHYYTTFVLAMAAGMSQEDARMLALGTQYVDENPLTKPMPSGTSPISMYQNAEALKKYHFVLPGGTNGDNMMNPSSEQLNNLENAAATAAAAGNRNACLQLAGEFLHTFEDTFSHRDYNNASFDPVVNINVIQWGPAHLTIEQHNLGLGHGLFAHDPDYTYNHQGNQWGEWTNDQGGTVKLFVPPHPVDWKVNETRTLKMEEAAFNKLLAYGDPSKAKSWSDISELMAQFNAVKENESDTPEFTGKLDKLKKLLDNLHIEGVDLKGADAYDEEDAKANRNANLKDLDPAKYTGVILK